MVNKKSVDLANEIKNTKEFKEMHKNKLELEKNRTLKKQLDSYVKSKNSIYSSYKLKDASNKMNDLNKEYASFFRNQIVVKYLNSNKAFNELMDSIYKDIEKQLLKK
ncbi:MAG: YlbF family regulator [Peptostreptococcaceae bacterium]